MKYFILPFIAQVIWRWLAQHFCKHHSRKGFIGLFWMHHPRDGIVATILSNKTFNTVGVYSTVVLALTLTVDTNGNTLGSGSYVFTWSSAGSFCTEVKSNPWKKITALWPSGYLDKSLRLFKGVRSVYIVKCCPVRYTLKCFVPSINATPYLSVMPLFFLSCW